MDEDDDVMYADAIAVVACNGHCAAHLVFQDEDGTIISEAALSAGMALELAEVLLKLANGEMQATEVRRLHA